VPPKPLSSHQVAAILGIKADSVVRLARRRGVGTQIERGTWLFDLEDVEALRVRKVGRPKVIFKHEDSEECKALREGK